SPTTTTAARGACRQGREPGGGPARLEEPAPGQPGGTDRAALGHAEPPPSCPARRPFGGSAGPAYRWTIALPGGPAAVDHDGVAGDQRRRRGCQEDDRAGDVH